MRGGFSRAFLLVFAGRLSVRVWRFGDLRVGGGLVLVVGVGGEFCPPAFSPFQSVRHIIHRSSVH